MSDKPFISIVIPIRDFERTIDKSFEYLLSIDYPHQDWEIIIADGGSTDKTLEIINAWQEKYDFIKLINIPDCPSPAFARNKALDIVKGEYIFFTDGDCAPCKDWVNIMLSKFAKDPKIGAVGGEIYTLRVDQDNLTEAYCEHFRFNMVSPRYGFIKEGLFPALSDRAPTQIAGHRAYFFVTANVAYRKEALDDAHARFWQHPTGEDMDMCLQIENRGWKLYFAPEAKVDHMHRSNFKALEKVWSSYAAAHPALIDKYASKNFEVVLQFIGNYPNNPVLKIPSPIRGFLYLGCFHLMHIFAFIFILGLISFIHNPGSMPAAFFTIAAFFLGIYYVYKFSYWCWFMKPRKYFFTWFRMKYLTNLSFIAGGLKDAKKYKVFCVEPSF